MRSSIFFGVLVMITLSVYKLAFYAAAGLLILGFLAISALIIRKIAARHD